MSVHATERFADLLADDDTVTNTFTGNDLIAHAEAIEWVDGEPTDYTLLVYLDEEVAAPSPRTEATRIRNLIHGVTFPFEVEIMGHGTVTRGDDEGAVAVAVRVEA